jgi:hypothetical protein
MRTDHRHCLFFAPLFSSPSFPSSLSQTKINKEQAGTTALKTCLRRTLPFTRCVYQERKLNSRSRLRYPIDWHMKRGRRVNGVNFSNGKSSGLQQTQIAVEPLRQQENEFQIKGRRGEKQQQHKIIVISPLIYQIRTK